MNRFEAQTTIARAADDVWAYAADIQGHPDWMKVADAHVLDGDGTHVGSRGRERLVMGPFTWDVDFEVAEAIPGRRIVWRAMSGAPMSLDVSLDIEPIDATSSHARYAAAFQMHGLWRILSPIVAMEGRTGQVRELKALKDIVEAASTAGTATP